MSNESNISIWEQVIKGNLVGQSSWEVVCKHCSHTFVANASKIKKHLLASGGVKACRLCPESVSTALRATNAAKAAGQESRKRTGDVQAEMDQHKKARTASGSPGSGQSTPPTSGQSRTEWWQGWYSACLFQGEHSCSRSLF